MRGPLSMLKGNPANESLLEYVSRFLTRLQDTCELARKRLKTVQSEMKIRYDRNTVHRNFQAGDKVFVLLPLSFLFIFYYSRYVPVFAVPVKVGL